MVGILRHSPHLSIKAAVGHMFFFGPVPQLFAHFFMTKPFFISQFQNLCSWLFSLPLLYLSLCFDVFPPNPVLSRSTFPLFWPIPWSWVITTSQKLNVQLTHSLPPSDQELPWCQLQHRPLPIPWPPWFPSPSLALVHPIWPTTFSKTCYEEANVQGLSPTGKEIRHRVQKRPATGSQSPPWTKSMLAERRNKGQKENMTRKGEGPHP